MEGNHSGARHSSSPESNLNSSSNTIEGGSGGGSGESQEQSSSGRAAEERLSLGKASDTVVGNVGAVGGSGEVGVGGASRTRETVQKVYQMIEKHKGATSSDSQFETNLYFDFETPKTGSGGSGSNSSSSRNRSQQQQRPRKSNNNYPNARSKSGTSLNSSGESNNNPGGSSGNSSNSTRRNSSIDVNANPSNVEAANNETEGIGDDEDALLLQSLRCPSERTEVISEREKRRRKRCSDYPGFAFGFGSVFGSDTMMKFSIIRNELDNVTKVQLKRVRESTHICISPCRYTYIVHSMS